MSVFSILIFLLLIIVVFFIGFYEIVNSKAFRISKIVREQHKLEIEAEREIQKSRQRYLEEIKNPDQIREIIEKIHRGEEVDIPLAAFTYIYQNIKKFTIFDTQGNLTVINEKDYFMFKEQAMGLLKSAEKPKLSDQELLDKINQKAEKDIEITEHPDGTIVKKDNVSRTVEITKKNGEIIFVDQKTNTMTTTKLVELKEKNESSGDVRKELIEARRKLKTEQEKNTVYQHELKLAAAELNKGKPSQISRVIEVDIAQNEPEEDFRNSQIFNFSSISKDAISDEININSSQEKPFQKEEEFLDDMPNIESISAMEKEVEASLSPSSSIEKIMFCDPVEFSDLDSFLKEIIDQTNVCDLVSYIVSDGYFDIDHNVFQTYIRRINDASTTHTQRIDDALSTHIRRTSDASTTHRRRINDACTTHVHVVNNVGFDHILISIHWFFAKIISLIEHKDHEKFINCFYTNPQKGFFDNKVLSLILSRINKRSKLSFASVFFFQEEKESQDLVNFRSAKIIDENNILWQGQYLCFFTKNKCGVKILRSVDKYSFLSSKCIVSDNDDKGERVTLSQIFS